MPTSAKYTKKTPTQQTIDTLKYEKNEALELIDSLKMRLARLGTEKNSISLEVREKNEHIAQLQVQRTQDKHDLHTLELKVKHNAETIAAQNQTIASLNLTVQHFHKHLDLKDRKIDILEALVESYRLKELEERTSTTSQSTQTTNL